MTESELQGLLAELEALRQAVARLERRRLRSLAARVLSSRRTPRFAALLVLAPVAAYASVTLPHIFVNGTIADAKEVNENFFALESEVNAHEASASAHHAKTVDAGELVSGTLANARLDPAVSLLGPGIGVAELEFDPATQVELDLHSGAPSAHHVKTTLFGELVDQIGDAQVPASFTRDDEVFDLVLAKDGPGSLLNADLLDGFTAAGFLHSNQTDSYTNGTFTFEAATTLDVDGTFRVAGGLLVGDTTSASYGYNRFSTDRFLVPESGAMFTQNDLFVADDLEVHDDLFVGSGGGITTPVITITGGADVSEGFEIRAPDARCEGNRAVDPGSVVCIDPRHAGELRVCTSSYDPTVAGIVSGAGGVTTGVMMGQQGTLAAGRQPVALTGRVYVRVDARAGSIEPGDLLTTSAHAGHAMKAVDPTRARGAILGKAMTGLDQGTGLVLALVSLQ
jgi:hypothetical protein